MEATARPWSKSGVIIYKYGTKNKIASTRPKHSDGATAAHANAELIVRAVNSHDKLMSALKMIDKALVDGLTIEMNDPIHEIIKRLIQ